MAASASFIYYYQTELAYYRELAQEFGRAHPEVGHLVAERGGDSAADRMFQGAALLTARLRQRVEDDFPEIVHPLFDQLWPQFLRPLPPVTLLQFTPLPNALRQSQSVAAATIVRSRPVADVDGAQLQCPFQTCSSLWIHPLELEEVVLHRPAAADLQLRLSFTVTGGARLGGLALPPLRLQLCGEPRTKLTLYAKLVSEARGISLQAGGRTVLRLPRSVIRPVGFEAEESLSPVPPRGALHLLQEYFVFPDKFLGVEVRGLDRLPEEADISAFDLVFHLGPMDLGGLQVDRQCFALGCIPAINLTDSQRADLRLSHERRRHPVRVPRQREIFEIKGVRAFDPRSGQWVEYPPLHEAQLADPQLPCHLVTRAVDVVEGVETFIEVVNAEGLPLVPPVDMLQVIHTTSNGSLALRLGMGEVDQPSPSSPEFATFTNITPVTPGLPMGLDRERYWRLLAKLNMHPTDLHRQEGLELLIDEAEGGRTGGGGPEILRVQVGTSSQLHRRMVVPMRQVELELADSSFLCPGQMYLFASVLDRLLARPPGSTVYNQLTVTGRPSGVVYRFPPR